MTDRADAEIDEDARVRAGVDRIKRLANLKVPPYDLPADSYLEDAVRDLFAMPILPTAELLVVEHDERWIRKPQMRWLDVDPTSGWQHPTMMFPYPGTPIARVLQQLWVNTQGQEKWRDVPVVKESKS